MNGSASGSLGHLKLKKGVYQMLGQVWDLAARGLQGTAAVRANDAAAARDAG